MASSIFGLHNYPSNWALGGAAICGIAATEMAIRAIRNIPNLSEKAKRYEFSADLGGALFYGFCATNIVPFSAAAGATIYTGYSLWTAREPENNYWSAFAINKSIRTIVNWAIVPLWNHVISPIGEKIWNVVSAILNNVSLPEKPAWWGVAVLVLALALYKGPSLLAGSSKALNIPISFQSPIVVNPK